MDYVVFVLVWAVINYFAAYFAKKIIKGFQVNPPLYAIGSIIFGGTVPLLFLAVKYFWFLYKKHKA